MKTAGIIVEYNPFHNGHEYHIARTRQITGADFVIAVMSGDFVQRGAPALTDKYARTRMALEGGADLVLELPVLFATGSAGDFAMGAVSLLDKLGVVDFLSFGSESGSIRPLRDAAFVLVNEPPAFSSVLQDQLRQGVSFPGAREAALASCLSTEFDFSPNNILGLEYCCALLRRNSAITPVTIRREGADYHDLFSDAFFQQTDSTSCIDALSSGGKPPVYASAEAIRARLFADPSLSWDGLSSCLPQAQRTIWEEILRRNRLLFPDSFTRELRFCLLSGQADGFEAYADVSRELSDKLKKNLFSFRDISQLCGLLKTRELTYTRISRALFHILLSIQKEDLKNARENDFISYARILGFRRSAAPLLSSLKKNSSIPLLTKLADASRLLPAPALSLLQADIRAAHLYESVMAAQTGTLPQNEYTRQICILD